jgi:hypothetical protein
VERVGTKFFAQVAAIKYRFVMVIDKSRTVDPAIVVSAEDYLDVPGLELFFKGGAVAGFSECLADGLFELLYICDTNNSSLSDFKLIQIGLRYHFRYPIGVNSP